jgi:L-alanine-DL-glutamate epimerase-like enolase superfamily enzyme
MDRQTVCSAGNNTIQSLIQVEENMAKAMKITKISIYKADIPQIEPFKIAIMEITDALNIYVKIETDSGLYGMGEASPFWRICGETQAISIAAARDLALLLKGKDPLAIEARVSDMQGYLDNTPTIRSAFDMALYDLLGKAAGLPLYAVLGGARRELVTDLTIGIGEVGQMAEKAKKIVARGFKAIKVKLGTTAAQDIARIRAIREAIGESVPIRIDANQGWDYNTALEVLLALEPLGVQYCEQPVVNWNYSDMAALRRRTTIPIMADDGLKDQHDAFKLCSSQACDYLNIKLSKAGGIRNALNICAVAESCGKACMVGCMLESRLGLTAAAHLASARAIIRFCDLDSALMLAEDPVTGGIVYEGDRVILPEAPGLGADIDPRFLAKLDSFSV